jgi:hypothetical protein
MAGELKVEVCLSFVIQAMGPPSEFPHEPPLSLNSVKIGAALCPGMLATDTSNRIRQQ